MAQSVFVLIFLITNGVYLVCTDDVTPVVSCNEDIIPAGESLICDCNVNIPPGTAVPDPPPTVTWPGHSNTSVLTVHNVQRADHGTKFTCEIQREGMETKNTTYTLRVACGPSKGKVKIEKNDPSRYFTTNGSKALTLSCNASDVYPKPHYRWRGLCESNRNDCTCRPKLDQDGGKVYCTVTNDITLQSETVDYTVQLNYPPEEPPQIVADNKNPALSSGDNLTCTVRGGKPLVASVNFYCTNPTLPDQDDFFNDGSVSSIVTVDTTKARETPMVCHCSAVWGLDEDLYQKRHSMEFVLELPEGEKTESEPHLVAVFVVMWILLIIAVIFIVIIIWRKRERQNSPKEPNNHHLEEAVGSGQLPTTPTSDDNGLKPLTKQVNSKSPTEDAKPPVDGNQASSSSNKRDNSSPVEQNAYPTSEAGVSQPSDEEDAEEPKYAASVSEIPAPELHDPMRAAMTPDQRYPFDPDPPREESERNKPSDESFPFNNDLSDSATNPVLDNQKCS